MYILTAYIILLLHLVTSQSSNENEIPNLKKYFRTVVRNIFSSFMNFNDNLRTYIYLPLNKLKERKTIIQQEFDNILTDTSSTIMTTRPTRKKNIIRTPIILQVTTAPVKATTTFTTIMITSTTAKSRTNMTAKATTHTRVKPTTTTTAKATTNITAKATTNTRVKPTKTITKKATTTATATTTTEPMPTATSATLTTTMKKFRRSFDLGLDPITLAPDMIKENGYKVEVHSLQTKDGYNLVLHRIPPHPRYKANKVALLHHGLLGSSEDWLLLGAKKALPYLMADAGYDVWLANARGNRYSKTHLRMPAEASANEYWNFSWHEIGYYDLSATIDYIIEVTDGFAKIDFVGYSMGATALLVLLSSLPQYNTKLRCAVLLAPLSYMYTATGPITYLAGLVDEQGLDALSFLGINEFMKKEMYPETMLKKFCVGPEILCTNPLLLLSNGGQMVSDKKLMENILKHVPGGGSTKTITHYCQLVKSGGFQMFDFGVSENVKRYGMRSPPMYRLTDVTVPLAVITASEDWLSTSSDVQNLIPRVPFAFVSHVIKQKEFSHTDFVFSENATQLVYCQVLYLLETIIQDRPLQLKNNSDVCPQRK